MGLITKQPSRWGNKWKAILLADNGWTLMQWKIMAVQKLQLQLDSSGVQFFANISLSFFYTLLVIDSFISLKYDLTWYYIRNFNIVNSNRLFSFSCHIKECEYENCVKKSINRVYIMIRVVRRKERSSSKYFTYYIEIYLYSSEKYFNYSPFVCSLYPPIGPRYFRRCFASPTAPNRSLRTWMSSIQLVERMSTPWRSRCTWKEKGRIRVLILNK